MRKFVFTLFIFTYLCDVKSTINCDGVNILKLRYTDQSDVVKVLCNANNYEFNQTNLTNYSVFTRIPIQIEKVHSPSTYVDKKSDDVSFISDRRNVCLKNVTKCLNNGKLYLFVIMHLNYFILLEQRKLYALLYKNETQTYPRTHAQKYCIHTLQICVCMYPIIVYKRAHSSNNYSIITRLYLFYILIILKIFSGKVNDK